MSQRQRRRKQQRREQAERRGPSGRQVAAGATIAFGATLAATGTAQAQDFTVSNLNDNGPGSLRQAVLDSNTNGNAPDNIVFASGLSGTIDVGSFNGDGLYPGTPVNIKGPGAAQITLRGVNGVGYVVFTGNYSSTGYPGEPITLSGLTITGGHADKTTYSANGGGIYNQGATLTVSKSVIAGNYAYYNGGGIYSSEGSLTVIDSTISGNTAEPTHDGYGGGIFASGDATVQRSAVFDNNARDGGGVYSSESDPNSLTIQSSTIARNHAVNDDGGGVWFCCGGSGEKLTIQGSTISGNSTHNTAGGVEAYLSDATVPRPEIDNTIISGNTSTNDPQYSDFYSAYPASVAFSVIGNPPPGPVGPVNQTGPNLLGVNPQLGPLQNNGGPTPTMALPSTSPAVDKGKAFGLTSDQRGVLRPIDFPSIANASGGDGSDIGAFELQPSNAIKLGKLKRNRHKGTAKQVVKVPQPAAGTLTIKGKGLKTKSLKIGKKTKKKIKLPVIPKGGKRAQENSTGSVSLKAKVTYKPTGNKSKTLKRKLKLLKQL
jgi:hypothetical protein